MKRRLGLISIVVFALEAGVVGGVVTSSLADEAGVEARIGELRGDGLFGLTSTDAVTPSLTASDVSISLAGYVLVYAVFVSFGVYYIGKRIHEGPTSEAKAIPGATGSRPMAFADTADTATGGRLRTGA